MRGRNWGESLRSEPRGKPYPALWGSSEMQDPLSRRKHGIMGVAKESFREGKRGGVGGGRGQQAGRAEGAVGSRGE